MNPRRLLHVYLLGINRDYWNRSVSTQLIRTIIFFVHESGVKADCNRLHRVAIVPFVRKLRVYLERFDRIFVVSYGRDHIFYWT